MSSIVAKRDREQRDQRTCLSDFSSDERKVIENARSWFPGDIAVFGSRARGDWADDSDIDLGVQGYQFKLHENVKKVLGSSFGLKVDLVSFEHALTHGSVVVV